MRKPTARLRSITPPFRKRKEKERTTHLLIDTADQIRKPETREPFVAKNRKEALRRINATSIPRAVHIDKLGTHARSAVQPWSIKNYNEGLLELLGDLVYIVVVHYKKRPTLLYTLEGKHFELYGLDSARNQVRVLRDSPLLEIGEKDDEKEKLRKEKTIVRLQKVFSIYNRLKYDDNDIATAEEHLRKIEENLALSFIE